MTIERELVNPSCVCCGPSVERNRIASVIRLIWEPAGSEKSQTDNFPLQKISGSLCYPVVFGRRPDLRSLICRSKPFGVVV